MDSWKAFVFTAVHQTLKIHLHLTNTRGHGSLGAVAEWVYIYRKSVDIMMTWYLWIVNHSTCSNRVNRVLQQLCMTFLFTACVLLPTTIQLNRLYLKPLKSIFLRNSARVLKVFKIVVCFSAVLNFIWKRDVCGHFQLIFHNHHSAALRGKVQNREMHCANVHNSYRNIKSYLRVQ